MFRAILFLLATSTGALAWENPPPMAPYQGKLSIISVPFLQVLRYCPGSGRAWACSYRGRDGCRIVLPNDLTPEIIASLKAHELAHCSGWRH